MTVYLDAPLLAGGVELVDTPGTGSVFSWDTVAAHEALESMDAAVFVVTAGPPVSAERDLYAKVASLSVATFTVLNKADHLDETGLRESAAELLGLDLAVPDPGGQLAEDRRFLYTTDEDAGQTELLAGAIRRKLPEREAAIRHAFTVLDEKGQVRGQ